MIDKSNKQHNPRPCCSPFQSLVLPKLMVFLSVKVFDLLYLNERCLVDRSVAFRKRNMRQYIKEIQGRIEFTTEFKAKSAKDVRQRMDQVMADRGEGLVMKAPGSAYVLNGRTNDWIKVRALDEEIWCVVGDDLYWFQGQARVHGAQCG